MGKSSRNGSFSMATSNDQRVLFLKICFCQGRPLHPYMNRYGIFALTTKFHSFLGLTSHEPSSQLSNRQMDGYRYRKIIEGSLETKVPTIWTDEKHGQEEAEPGRNSDV